MFLFLDESLLYDESNKSYLAELPRGTVYYAIMKWLKSVDESVVCDHSNESC